jgi:hypothetical protein
MAISHLPATGATALEGPSTGATRSATVGTRAAAHSSLIVPLFATTMFLSGFLLFLVEPMAAKMVLPILGGVPMAWNRPEAPLTEFYFWVSLGGMLGGLFNTLAAPVLFDSIVEYPLVVLLACLMFRMSDADAPARRSASDAIVPLVVGGQPLVASPSAPLWTDDFSNILSVLSVR